MKTITSTPLQVVTLTHDVHANQLLHVGGWKVVNASYDYNHGSKILLMEQYEPFFCPLCRAALNPDQVKIDFVLGHQIKCDCTPHVVRLLDKRLDDYFNAKTAAGTSQNAATETGTPAG